MKKNKKLLHDKKVTNDLTTTVGKVYYSKKSLYVKVKCSTVKLFGFGPAYLFNRLVFKQIYWAKKGKLNLDGSFFYRREEIIRDLETKRDTVSRWIRKLQNTKLEGEPVLIVKKGHQNRNEYLIPLAILQYLIGLDEEIELDKAMSEKETENRSNEEGEWKLE